MTTARTITQEKLDTLNADILANPIVVDPRVALLATLEAEVATTKPWFDTEIDELKTFLASLL